MKNLILFGVLLSMLLATIPASSQTSKTQVYDMPFDVTWSVPCANGGLGEDVHIAGTVHAVETTVINKNTLHVIFTYNAQGMRGVGLTTGLIFRATGVTRQDFNVNGPVYPYTITFVNRNNIVSEGSAANDKEFWETAHLTVNAGGVTTVFFDNPVISCK